MDCVIVQTTLDDAGKADTLAREIVVRRLAACVQRVPVTSTYRWKGEIETAQEYLLLAKTTREMASSLMAFVRERHDYELPEIVCTPIQDGLPAYLEWVRTCSSPDAGSERP